MSKLTEKLGIKSFETWNGDVKNLINANKQGNEASIYRQLKMADYMQDLEQQRNDLLKISLAMIFDRGDWLEYYPEEIKVIEGIAKMKLEEIKQLIGE